MSERVDSIDPEDETDQVVLDGAMLIEHLATNGIVTEVGDDIDLTSEFRRDWRDRIEAVRTADDPRQPLANLLDVDPGELRLVEADDQQFTAYYDGEAALVWESKAGFVADTAVYAALSEWLPVWEQLDDVSRNELLVRLRGFLDECPVCDGRLAIDERTGTGGTRTEVSIECLQCGRGTFEGTFL